VLVDFLDDNLVMLLIMFPSGESLPLALVKSQAEWRVDAAPLIAARQAAAEVQKRQVDTNRTP
jgi:hypothetical protein